VERDDRLLELGHAPPQIGDALRDLVGQRIADRVGDVDRARARGERRAHDVDEEVRVGARGVHRAELDVVRELARARDRVLDHAEHLVATLAQLVRELHVACVDEGVDARRLGPAQRLGRRVDVERHRARERAHARAAHGARDLVDGVPLGGRRRGEARLDHVDAHRGQRERDLDLLRRAEADARGLLPIAQGGIEDDDSLGNTGHDALLPFAETRRGAGPGTSRGPETRNPLRPGSAGEGGWLGDFGLRRAAPALSRLRKEQAGEQRKQQRAANHHDFAV
jgi:hypothetical protein